MSIKKELSNMGKIGLVLALLILALGLVALVSAFTPQDDINLRNVYNINNTKWIKGYNWMDGFETFENTNYHKQNLTNASYGFFDYISATTVNATLISGDMTGTTVNASSFWITSEGVLNNVADISVSWLNNNLNWINITQVISTVGDWATDKPFYYNTTQTQDLFAYRNGTNTNLTYIDFDYPSDPTHKEGRVFYSQEQDSLAYYNDESDVTVNIGQENMIKVKNTQGSTIYDGNIVYVAGSSGDNPEVKLAQADNLTKAQVLGMVTQTSISNNGVGYVTTFGLVRGLNTTLYNAGDQLYLSATSEGEYTIIKPTNPHIAHGIGSVVRSHASEGIIFVKPFRDNHNFNMSSVIFANGNGEMTQDYEFTYDSSTNTLTVENLVTSGNVTATINSSEYWDDLNSPNATQFSEAVGILNLDLTWLESFIDEVGDYFSGSWNDLTDVPAGFADNIDNDTDTHVEGDGVYLYSDATTMYFNETKLNQSVDLLQNDTDTRHKTDGIYLYNSSEYIYFNETKLNQTIDLRAAEGDGKIGAGHYLYNDSTSIYLNETRLNATIDARDTGQSGLTHLSNFTDDLGARGYTHLSNFTDNIGVGDDWDNISDVPTATPANGLTTFLSTADQIYDWVISLAYITALEDDPTPQLGGYLDTDGFDIGSTDDEIEDIYLGDSRQICFGDDQDACIVHDGVDSISIDGYTNFIAGSNISLIDLGNETEIAVNTSTLQEWLGSRFVGELYFNETTETFEHENNTFAEVNYGDPIDWASGIDLVSDISLDDYGHILTKTITTLTAVTPANGQTSRLSTADQIYDWAVGLFVQNTGDSMTGSLNMTGNNVTDLDYLKFEGGGYIYDDGSTLILGHS